jgi:hypothetical protein
MNSPHSLPGNAAARDIPVAGRRISVPQKHVRHHDGTLGNSMLAGRLKITGPGPRRCLAEYRRPYNSVAAMSRFCNMQIPGRPR